jgi:putative transposase
MSKLRIIEVGNYYHFYSRGINKSDIFIEEQDYYVFMRIIGKTNCPGQNDCPGQNELVKIFCYTLMPNHFHFILEEITERGVSLFFQKILSQYVRYFNKKYQRRGPLFESRFKDKIIEDDLYFLHLINYIWNNPIKIINPTYQSKDLLNGKIILSQKEKDFARNYPYKFFPLAQGKNALGK